jgi:hypothetical protein
MARIAHHKRNQRAGGPELLIALAFLGGLLVLVGLGVYFVGRPSPEPAAGLGEGELAVGRPIQATHQMGDSPPIPFLPADGPQPNVAVVEAFYDFGRIGAKDVVARTFVVRNTGEAPLTISHAYTTCGCTTAEISADVIPPGQAATIALRFDAGFHDSAGQTVRRGVILENNDPEQPQIEIWVQAEVGNE